MSKQAPTSRPFPQSILCAMDAHGRSEHAIHAAVWLAEQFGAHVELVHAYPERPVMWGSIENLPEWEAGREATGQAIREELVAVLGRAPKALGLRTKPEALRFHIEIGPTPHVVLERAKEAKADLIVFGSHERRGVLDLGSSARAVASKFTGAVWVQAQELKPVRRILVPIDLSEDSLHALGIARDFAKKLGARVVALHAFETPVLGAGPELAGMVGQSYVIDNLRRTVQENFEKAVADFDWKGIDHQAAFEIGRPADCVLGHQKDFDLIVLGTHGHTGWSAAILGGVTYGILREARIPVMAVRLPGRKFRSS